VRIAVDTNVLAYAEGVNGDERMAEAVALLSRIPTESIVVPTQVLLELFNVMVRKAGWSRTEARAKVTEWREGYQLAATSGALLDSALDAAVAHQLQIFDAVILATAAEAGCALLLSEDMHEGFAWNGVTVTNPFQVKRHVWLEMLLDEGGSAY
jgi:predicted nucleic acid-binding protein